MFREKLNEVALLINHVIREDSFPGRIEPEYLRDSVRAYPCIGGKRIRPALVMWSCGLLGGEPQKAKYVAGALEIYHNWTLVHDDIIDNDDFRRGVPSVHKQLSDLADNEFTELGRKKANEFGKSFAILAGDIQQGWAINMLLNSKELGVSDELILAMTKRLQDVLNRGLISGEALDVEFAIRGWKDISPEEVEKMISLKTGLLLKISAEFGAAIALECSDFNNPKISKLGKFALCAGMAFQLRDDWLGFFADQQELGKPICSDITEEKPTLILITALNNLDDDKKRQLLSYIGCKDLQADDIDKIKELITISGADKIVLDKADNFVQEAKSILNEFEDNQYLRLLNDFVEFMTQRKM